MSDLHSPVRELFRFASMKVALHLQFCSTYKLQGVRRQSFFFKFGYGHIDYYCKPLVCAVFHPHPHAHCTHFRCVRRTHPQPSFWVRTRTFF